MNHWLKHQQALRIMLVACPHLFPRANVFNCNELANQAGIVLASGAVAEGNATAQIVGGILAVLAQLGYTASRTQDKKAAG